MQKKSNGTKKLLKQSKDKKIHKVNESNIPIIKKIENYFSEKDKEIKGIIDFKKNYQTNVSKTHFNVLEFILDDKFIFSTKFNYYGIYQEGIFYWANTFHGIDKRFIEKINEVKSFSHLFENSNDPDMLLFHHILTNDSFNLDTDKYNKFLKLLMYLDKSYYFITPYINNEAKAIITLKEDKGNLFFEKKM